MSPRPGPGTSFAALGLSPPLLRAAAACGLVEPTPVQAASLPPALQGRDVFGCAPTGSGKTAAFGLALLQHLEPGLAVPRAPAARPGRRRTGALVLVPTQAEEQGRVRQGG